MPSPRISNRNNNNNNKAHHQQEKNKKVRALYLSEKASSFHGRGFIEEMTTLSRPRTVPDLLAGKRVDADVAPAPAAKQLTKLLVNVTIQRSPGPVQLVVSPESTVRDLIAVALRQYAKEARRPVLPSGDPAAYQLHYSQFSLESLSGEEKVIALGSRNFFMCPKSAASTSTTTTNTNCSKEADNPTHDKALSWLKFMDFLL